MQILAGDWPKDSKVTLNSKTLDIKTSFTNTDSVPLSHIALFDIVGEDNHPSISSKLGWGAAGAIVAGPIGLVAGIIAGGNKKERIMSIKFKDGKKLLLRGTAKDAEILMAASF